MQLEAFTLTVLASRACQVLLGIEILIRAMEVSPHGNGMDSCPPCIS